jgi:energy-coupling factor transporter ATP-binding protein EcfA2
VVALLGRSGSGKSTLLRLLAGLDATTSLWSRTTTPAPSRSRRTSAWRGGGQPGPSMYRASPRPTAQTSGSPSWADPSTCSPRSTGGENGPGVVLTDPPASPPGTAHRRPHDRRRRACPAGVSRAPGSAAGAMHGVGLDTTGADGLNLWVRVPSEREALRQLESVDIGVAPGSPFLVEDTRAEHVRITCAALTTGQDRLAALLAGPASRPGAPPDSGCARRTNEIASSRRGHTCTAGWAQTTSASRSATTTSCRARLRETCGGVAGVMAAWWLTLATGEPRLADQAHATWWRPHCTPAAGRSSMSSRCRSGTRYRNRATTRHGYARTHRPSPAVRVVRASPLTRTADGQAKTAPLHGKIK